ncbi:MAG: Do family serine endopeptidase [Bacteroidota bacterium]
MIKRIAGVFLLSMIGAMSGMGLYEYFFSSKEVYYLPSPPIQPVSSRYTPTSDHQGASPQVRSMNFPDFVLAADMAKPAVVHIRSSYDAKRKSSHADFFSNPWQDYFDDDMYNGHNGIASGSGVIISGEGYIITNNHVIEDANKIEVTLSDNRSFPAKLIGTDANTDLAVLKVESTFLPYLTFGDSDEVRVGEWVLAVGNPMDLNSTVTAGIVSAKGRDINLLRNDATYPVESFIQTDAAVNRGNSGGALINDQGELIGINTAIASRTGFYAGYSFAIPASIAQKVMEDLITYGKVKRGILGVNIRAVDAELAEKHSLQTLRGAFIDKVLPGSGAQEAGIETGDIIISVNDIPVNSTPELQEQVSRYRPGENIEIRVFRKGVEKVFIVSLKSLEGEESISLRSGGKENIQFRGNRFRMPNENELEQFEAKNGIILEQPNQSFYEAGIEGGFFIEEINGKQVKDIDQLYLLLLGSRKSLHISGLTPQGKAKSYDIDW